MTNPLPPRHSPCVAEAAKNLRSGMHARRAALLLGVCSLLFGAQAAHADPLPTPSFSGPLTPNSNPLSLDAGPFGPIYITGQISGIGALQSNATHAGGIGNNTGFVDLSNAQIEIQTNQGPLQFYVQGGAYSLPSLGTSYLQATKATDQLFGPIPVAYAKAVITPELSVTAGLLPTMVGAESTFTFQNINIERGLLWNQEPAISRGVQINYARGPLSAAISLNDGYFSGKLNWLSGSISYAVDSSNSLTFVGAGSLSRNDKSSSATPLAQNNSSIFNLIYSYTSGPLTLTPYLQYSHVGRDDQLGINRSADTYGGALLVKYALNTEWSLGARAEYLKTTGGTCGADAACTPTNLLYGAKSNAWSLTITPTYQKGVFFARGELSYSRVGNLEAGYGFGRDLNRRDQMRALLETGILF
ncbi:outer membrane beta-barrel protein [Hyphomicrobium sp. B1]|uniref:outer membrane beta-barrel protein n=1 Tax=Hyphomicrobium sp. B1 TaxID=3075651 RepID=UPI003C2C746D